MTLHVGLHANCPDGTCAGWVVMQAIEEGGRPVHGDGDYTLHWLNYDSVLPSPDSSEDRLWLIDYSRSPETISDEAGWELKHVMILDHHQSALEDWRFSDRVRLDARSVFDLGRSGAGLAWDVLRPGVMRPALVNYVEDRDLWTFALPGSRAVAAWVRTHPLNQPAVWAFLAADLEADLAGIVMRGEAILASQAMLVQEQAARAVWMEVGGYRVPVVNATTLYSEVGEALCLRYPEAPFAAYYFDRGDGVRQWGARSRGDFNLVPVARAYGGGGHPGAAGWTSASGAVGPGGQGG